MHGVGSLAALPTLPRQEQQQTCPNGPSPSTASGLAQRPLRTSTSTRGARTVCASRVSTFTPAAQTAFTLGTRATASPSLRIQRTDNSCQMALLCTSCLPMTGRFGLAGSEANVAQDHLAETQARRLPSGQCWTRLMGRDMSAFLSMYRAHSCLMRMIPTRRFLRQRRAGQHHVVQAQAHTDGHLPPRTRATPIVSRPRPHVEHPQDEDNAQKKRSSRVYSTKMKNLPARTPAKSQREFYESGTGTKRQSGT